MSSLTRHLGLEQGITRVPMPRKYFSLTCPIAGTSGRTTPGVCHTGAVGCYNFGLATYRTATASSIDVPSTQFSSRPRRPSEFDSERICDTHFVPIDCALERQPHSTR